METPAQGAQPMPQSNIEGRLMLAETSIERIGRSVEEAVKDFRKAQDDQEREVRREMSALNTNLSTQIQGLANQFNERNRMPWATLIGAAMFLLAFITTIGGMAYWPILSNISDLKEMAKETTNTLIALRDYNAATYVTKAELDARAERGREDRDRVTREIAEVRSDVKGIVSRAEHQERWRAIDNQFGDLQRQLDEVKRQQGDVYTARDAILDLKQRLDRLDEARVVRP